MIKHLLNRRLFAAAPLVALLAGCATPPAPQIKSGRVPAGAFVQSWTAPIQLAAKTTVRDLTLNNGRLFLATSDNVVVALTPTGSIAARVTVAEPIEQIRGPVFTGDKIVVPTSSTLEVYRANGLFENSVTLGSPTRGNAAVAGGDIVYIATDSNTGGRLAKVSLAKGDALPVSWDLLTGAIVSTPVVHEGFVYAATEAGTVYALTPERQAVWPATEGLRDGLFRATDRITADIRVDDSGVYVASRDGRLYVLDPNSGRIRWRFVSGVALEDAPGVADDSVYQYVPGRGLLAFDKAAATIDRTPRWTLPEGRRAVNQDAINTYVVTSDGLLLAVDKKTGIKKFVSGRKDLKFYVQHFDPADSTIYAATADGKIVAIKPQLKAGTEGILVDAGGREAVAAAQ